MQSQRAEANSAGRPVMNRNARRMFDFNTKKFNAAPVAENWADEPEPPQPRTQNRGRQTNRSKGFRKEGRPPKKTENAGPVVIQDPAEITPTVVKASKENLRDEPLWQEGPYNGTQPITRIYSQNMDFSTFPILCERVYGDLEAENPRLRREVPFCAFQHVYTSVLNAVVIDHIRTVNAEDRYADEESPLNLIPDDFVTPVPITEYFKMIANTTTPQGDMVKVNIPEIGVPQGTIPAEGDGYAIPSGSFGRITANDHNKYECYVSPYITSQLILETRRQNEDRRFRAWNPMPDGSFPNGAVPNLNLLGFRQNVERLNPEGVQAIADVDFPDNDGMSGRLRWCPELVARVSSHLRKMGDRYKMVIGKPSHGSNSAAIGWTTVSVAGNTAADHNKARLSSINGPVKSSVAMGSAQCNIAGIFGLKRERTAAAKGLCYTLENGHAPAGWAVSINRNFRMEEPFLPEIGIDMSGLRTPSHENASPSGDVSYYIMQ